MKRLISFVAASAVTLTAFTSFASASTLYSFYDEEPFSGELNSFNVPSEDFVPVGLNVDLAWNNETPYKNAITKLFSNSATPSVADVTFDAEADLNMSNVAREWVKILSVASGDNAGKRALAIQNAKLEGQFTLTIEDTSAGGPAIVNDKVTGIDSTVLDWVENTAGYRVTDFFELLNMEKVGNQYVITMVLKDYNDYPEINSSLDTYFTALAAAENAEEYSFLLDIADSNVPVPVNSGTYQYRGTGTFGGYVNITLGQTKVSTIWFGTGAKDPAGANVLAEDSATITVTKSGRGGSGGGGGTRVTPTPTAAPTETPTEIPTDAPTATPVPEDKLQEVRNSSGAQLNIEDHYAYIIGYSMDDDARNEVVRPAAYITRAEVATIFFRLLTNESREKFWSQTNNFSDVTMSDWYNNAISTAANAGIVTGYEDGTFKPDEYISRAEFATIAARFSTLGYAGEDKFTDISKHWARDMINKAAETGWINGYDDGTFRPDMYITRAEAMTLINRMLYRLAENSSIREDGMIVFDDNKDKSMWYYANVQEATNSHEYNRIAKGYVETWKVVVEAPDWEALEKEWSTAATVKTEDLTEDLDTTPTTSVEEATEAPAEETETEAPAED